MCFFSLWKNLRSRSSPSHYGCNSTDYAWPINSQTQVENMDKQKFVECYISNSQYNIWCPIYDFFGQTFELTPPQHFKKGTFYMTEDGHISNCFVHQTFRYMTVLGHMITFNKFLLVHIFQLCLWIVWTGVIGAVATIMTWWRTTS